MYVRKSGAGSALVMIITKKVFSCKHLELATSSDVKGDLLMLIQIQKVSFEIFKVSGVRRIFS